MEKRHRLTNNTSENRYELEVEGAKAYIDYRIYTDTVELTYTYVPETLRHRSTGSELVQGVLEQIRSHRMKVVPTCGYVAAWIRTHPEWEAMVTLHPVEARTE